MYPTSGRPDSCSSATRRPYRPSTDPRRASGRRRRRGVPGTTHRRRRPHPDRRPSALGCTGSDRTRRGALAAAIEDRDWSDWYAWAGPEAASLKTFATGCARHSDSPSPTSMRRRTGTRAAKWAVRRDERETPAPTVAPVRLRRPPKPEAVVVSDRSRRRRRDGGGRRPPDRLLAPLKPQLIATGVLRC